MQSHVPMQFPNNYGPNARRASSTTRVATKKSLEDIEGYTRETIELQRAMRGITERLFKHTRGTTAPNV